MPVKLVYVITFNLTRELDVAIKIKFFNNLIHFWFIIKILCKF